MNQKSNQATCANKCCSPEKFWLFFAAISGFLAVFAGALGNHTELHSLMPMQYGDYLVAVRYQMWHSIVLLAISFYLLNKGSHKGRCILHAAAALFSLGIVFFSGGIYLASLTQLSFVAYFVPIGGCAFSLGWLVLVIYSLRICCSRS